MRVFKEHLYHTPLRLMGINRDVHVPVANFAQFDRIGRALAPVEPWGRYIEDLELDGESGGMTTLKMSQLKPKGRPPGSEINITVAPSSRIGGGRFGVYVQVNDQFAVRDAEDGGGEQLMRFLEDSFEASIRRSDGIVHHILSLAKES